MGAGDGLYNPGDLCPEYRYQQLVFYAERNVHPMNGKRFSNEKARRNGFYLALAVCLVAVGVAAWRTYDAVNGVVEPAGADPGSSRLFQQQAEDVRSGQEEGAVEDQDPEEPAAAQEASPAPPPPPAARAPAGAAAPQEEVTKRFIATAMSGLPDETRVEQMHRDWSGRLVTVIVRQHDIDDENANTRIPASGQNISELISKHGVASNLIYGGIDTVQGVAIGAITYTFDGPAAEVGPFLAELAENSDIVDFGTAAEPVDYAQAVERAGIAAPENRAADDYANTNALDFEQVDDVVTVSRINGQDTPGAQADTRVASDDANGAQKETK